LWRERSYVLADQDIDGPGGAQTLNGLVLAYLAEHKGDGPLTATAIGKRIGRSAGAVANCLGRLAKDKKVRQAHRKPRSYVIGEAK
jgi:hypothetical protein